MQAALITAYKDRDQLCRLVTFLSKGMKVFVHVDQKSPLDPREIEERGARVLRRYRVGWGSYNHLAAILDLMELATADPEVDYLHILSGQDMPLHSLPWFEARFGGSQDIFAFITDESNAHFHPDWYRHFHPATFFGFDQRTAWGRRLENAASRLQQAAGFRRNGLGPYRSVYKSLVYVSLPAEAARYALQCHRGSRSLRFALRSSLIPEELFFMTVLNNSRFSGQIRKQELHYSDWSFRNDAYPAYLDETDYARIYGESDETLCAFARKVDSICSYGLIRRIADRIGMEM